MENSIIIDDNELGKIQILKADGKNVIDVGIIKKNFYWNSKYKIMQKMFKYY